MNKERINEIGLNANIAILRVQLDALLTTLPETERAKYQSVLFEKIQVLLESAKTKYITEEYNFFKGLLEDVSIRNEIDK